MYLYTYNIKQLLEGSYRCSLLRAKATALAHVLTSAYSDESSGLT